MEMIVKMCADVITTHRVMLNLESVYAIKVGAARTALIHAKRVIMV